MSPVNVGKTAAQRGFLPSQLVHFFVKVSRVALFAGIATLGDAGTLGKIYLCRRLHSPDLLCTGGSDHLVMRGLEIQQQCKTLS